MFESLLSSLFSMKIETRALRFVALFFVCLCSLSSHAFIQYGVEASLVV